MRCIYIRKERGGEATRDVEDAAQPSTFAVGRIHVDTWRVQAARANVSAIGTVVQRLRGTAGRVRGNVSGNGGNAQRVRARVQQGGAFALRDGGNAQRRRGKRPSARGNFQVKRGIAASRVPQRISGSLAVRSRRASARARPRRLSGLRLRAGPSPRPPCGQRPLPLNRAATRRSWHR